MSLLLQKKTNLRNYVVVGNEDTQELLASNTFGKVTQIKVAYNYVWFKVKNKQLICNENVHYNQISRLLENILMSTLPIMGT